MGENMGRMRQFRTGSFSGMCVLYWMVRDKRVRDNWALLEDQKKAIENKVPLLVVFNYHNSYREANKRQYSFLFYGLQEVHNDLKKLNIQFFLLSGLASETIPKFIEDHKVGLLITDFSPLKVYTKRLRTVVKNTTIPITQVDTHNIIPVWNASPKKEYAAYTIRPKIKKLMPKYLTDIPKLKRHPVQSNFSSVEINWKKIV